MNRSKHLLVALGLTHALLGAAHAQTESGLQVISNLAQLNGQALACQDLKSAGRAKRLMLAHAPKTARFGTAFEEGTQQGYLAQTRNKSACPGIAALSARLDALAQQLQINLPAKAQDAAANTSAETQ